jgi:type I site-specific restriction endonuclease
MTTAPVKMEDTPRVERLIALAERLIAALESDIAELKNGRTATLSTSDPEVQKLTALYTREAQGFDPRIAQSAPPTLRQRFVAITAKFREVLQLHARMIARVKNASEGIIRAIADEVERTNAPIRTYGPRPGYAPKSSGAMLFNRVV